MTRKDRAIKAIQGLPDSATWEDIEECVRFLGGIDKGLADIKGGVLFSTKRSREA